MKIHWKEDGSYYFKTDNFFENFKIRVADGLLEAGLFKIPRGYVRMDRKIRDIDVGTYYIWPIIPFVIVWHKILDKFEN